MPFVKYHSSEVLTMEEMAKIVDVLYIRFWRYVKAGIIPEPLHQLGIRKYYKKEDIAKIRKVVFKLKQRKMPMIRNVDW